MTIRNGRPGDIVYLNHGFGAKAVIVGKRDLRLIRPHRGIFYTLKILEDKGVHRVGNETDQRALTLARDRSNGIPEGMRFGE